MNPEDLTTVADSLRTKLGELQDVIKEMRRGASTAQQGKQIQNVSFKDGEYIVIASGFFSRNALAALGLMESEYSILMVDNERVIHITKEALERVLGLEVANKESVVGHNDSTSILYWAHEINANNPEAVRHKRADSKRERHEIVKDKLDEILKGEFAGLFEETMAGGLMVKLKSDVASSKTNYEIVMPSQLPRKNFAKAVGIKLAEGETIDGVLPGKALPGGFAKVVTIDQKRLEEALCTKHGVEFPEIARG